MASKQEEQIRKLIKLLIRENWEENYKQPSSEEDLGLSSRSKTLYDDLNTKKKIRNYLRRMKLI